MRDSSIKKECDLPEIFQHGPFSKPGQSVGNLIAFASNARGLCFCEFGSAHETDDDDEGNDQAKTKDCDEVVH